MVLLSIHLVEKVCPHEHKLVIVKKLLLLVIFLVLSFVGIENTPELDFLTLQRTQLLYQLDVLPFVLGVKRRLIAVCFYLFPVDIFGMSIKKVACTFEPFVVLHILSP